MNEQLENQPVSTDNSAFCKKCNAALKPEQKFCSNCGTAVNPVTKITKKPFIMSIIKNSVLLALTIFMLISAFAPIVKIDMDDEFTNEDIAVGFGTIDGITMFVNSVLKIETDEASEAAAELTEEMFEYITDWEEGDELDKFSQYTKKMLYLSLRSEENTTPVGVIFVCIFSIAQITLAVLFAVFAALSFASVFTDSVKSHFNLSFLFMGLSTIILSANAYSFKLLLGYGNIRLSGIAVFTIILSISIIIAFFVLRLVIDKARLKVGVIVKHALSLTFAIIILFAASAPIVTTEIKTAFDGTDEPKRVSTTLDGSMFSDFQLSETDKEYYTSISNLPKKAMVKELMEEFKNYTYREFKKGEATAENTTLYTFLLMAFGASEYSAIFAFGTAAMILTFACALILIWQNLHELATGKRLHLSISLSAKIVAIVMITTVLTLAIVMSFIVTNNANVVDAIYKSKIAYGPILMLICAITAICIPPAEPKKINATQAIPSTENTTV